MRFVKQRKLHFQEGSSDKLYEVDLCEAGEGEFVVNFRYGRRGATLRDGTKTVFPVGLEEAEQIFEKLVSSKVRKGYRDIGASEQPAAAAPSPAADTPSAPEPLDGLRAKVLEHLESAANGSPPAGWRLSRLIWRAGELRIAQAVAPLCKIATGAVGDPMTRYALAWGIGRCGNGQPEVVSVLEQLAVPTEKTMAAARMARFALADTDATMALLPPSLQTAVEQGDADQLRQALQRQIETTEPPFDVLEQVYVLGASMPHAREAVYEIASVLPLKPPFFRHIRYLFKAAEFRLDAEMFGMLSRRFESSLAYYQSSAWGGNVWVKGINKAFNPDIESKKPDSKIAYSSRTRQFLRRRVVRTLERAGEASDAQAFITLATGVLLSYQDERDRKEPTGEMMYHSGWVTIHSDEFGTYHPFNYLLYGNSRRYRQQKSLKWVCDNGYSPGDAAPEEREEAFPKLWDHAPDALMHILRASECARVVDFAVKVWRANSAAFDPLADIPFICDLLGRPYVQANVLGTELARSQFDPSSPDTGLLKALVECQHQPARELGMELLGQCRGVIAEDIPFTAALITARFPDVQIAARQLLTVSTLGDAEKEELVPLVVAILLELDPADEAPPERARNARETLLLVAGAKLREVNPEIVATIVAHPLEDVQLLGAHIALQFEQQIDQLSGAVLESLLLSEFASVREIGMRLFGALSDEDLLKRQEILASFCISKREDLRVAARPIVGRLAVSNPEFAKDIVSRFYPLLLRKESHEGLHADVYELLEGPLGGHLDVIPAEHGLRMVDSRYTAAQRLGLLLIQKFIDLKTIPMRSIARMAGSELLDLREYIAAFYRENPDFIKQHKGDALRVLDSDWQDARAAGFEFFSSAFTEDDWTPALLVSICDSVRPDVQAFGRERITRFFNNEDGPEYLLKLSQHPSSELQTFATNYLERYAAGEPGRIAELEPFFITVLCLVNRGRVAKDRVLTFLKTQALADESVAVIVARILKRHSATIAIGDKAACIESLLVIQKAWPALAEGSPLVRREYATCSTD